MTKIFKRRPRLINNIKVKPLKENLNSYNAQVPLNNAQSDRLTFSVLRSVSNKIRKIENVSYEININNKWEWVVRYDDHGGTGKLHRHIRISLKNQKSVISVERMRKKYRDKNHELTWICKEIRREYLIFRKKLLKESGIKSVY